MIDYRLEHLCSYSATLNSPPEVIGPVPEGLRVNFYVTGGELRGPRLSGRLRPVGGDWLTIRTDGVGMLDVRVTIETSDGALLYVTYAGMTDLGETGYQDFLEGRMPKRLRLHTVPRFRVADERYRWLNRLQCLGVGEADLEAFEVRYDVYAVR